MIHQGTTFDIEAQLALAAGVQRKSARSGVRQTYTYQPWLGPPPDYTTINAAAETADAHFVYNFTCLLFALRSETPPPFRRPQTFTPPTPASSLDTDAQRYAHALWSRGGSGGELKCLVDHRPRPI